MDIIDIIYTASALVAVLGTVVYNRKIIFLDQKTMQLTQTIHRNTTEKLGFAANYGLDRPSIGSNGSYGYGKRAKRRRYKK